MTRSKKFYPLLFVAALFAVLIGYIEMRLPVRVDAQGRDGVYQKLSVTETGASALRVAGGIHAGGKQVVKADGFIPRTALSIAAGSAALAGGTYTRDVSLNRYALLPRLSAPSNYSEAICNIGAEPGSSSVQDGWIFTGSSGITRIRVQVSNSTILNACTISWDYLATSDNPSLWILLAADGSVGSIWESEDPAGSVAPLSIPQDDDGNDLPGFTVVNVGLPSLPVIEALYSGLTLAQRTAALTCTGDYVESRGWLTAFSTLANLGGIESRYEPSGRQWAMRCAANAGDKSVTMLYLDELLVTAGAWALKP